MDEYMKIQITLPQLVQAFYVWKLKTQPDIFDYFQVYLMCLSINQNQSHIHIFLMNHSIPTSRTIKSLGAALIPVLMYAV